MFKIRIGLLAALLLIVTSAANANLVGSAFTADVGLGIGEVFGTVECKSAAAAGIVGAGVEVTGANYTGGCRGYVNVDIGSSLITLTGVQESGIGDYRWMLVDLAFTGAPAINSVTLVSQNLFLAQYENPAPVIGFTGNSISLSWDSTGSGIFWLADGGTAVFEVNAVPEPSSMLLLATGLAAGLTILRRRK